MRHFFLLCAFSLVNFGLAQDARAERHALVIGVNQGPSPLLPLRYAHEDARKIQEILIELGNVAKDKMRLLLEPDLEELRSVLWTLTSAAKPGDELLFYYSGHADDSGLLLHNEIFPQSEIRSLIDDGRFKVRLAVIDACKSGAFTRAKGGSFGPPVAIDWSSDSEAKGAVLITSSSAEEASVERDDLGGSLFTHYWASALRGAADRNGDASVTLSEAFSYAYEKTVIRSSESRSGLQHPNYDYEIKGRGELKLTTLKGGASLLFPATARGTYLVFHRARGSLVAEIDKVDGEEKQLLIPPGDYVIKKRIRNASLFTRVSIGDEQQQVVNDALMKTVSLEDDLSKGYQPPIFEPTWRYGAAYPNFSAHTLRNGESSIGLQRLQYGISDDVTVFTSPMAALIGLPIFGVEFNVFRGTHWLYSMELVTTQSLPKEDNPRGWHETRLETTLTFQPLPFLQFSALTGWALESGPDESLESKPWEFQKLSIGASITWAPLDWLFIQASTKDSTFFYGTEVLDIELIKSQAVIGVAWGPWRAAVGAALGKEHIFEEDDGIEPTFDLWVRW